MRKLMIILIGLLAMTACKTIEVKVDREHVFPRERFGRDR